MGKIKGDLYLNFEYDCILLCIYVGTADEMKKDLKQNVDKYHYGETEMYKIVDIFHLNLKRAMFYKDYCPGYITHFNTTINLKTISKYQKHEKIESIFSWSAHGWLNGF